MAVDTRRAASSRDRREAGGSIVVGRLGRFGNLRDRVNVGFAIYYHLSAEGKRRVAEFVAQNRDFSSYQSYLKERREVLPEQVEEALELYRLAAIARIYRVRFAPLPGGPISETARALFGTSMVRDADVYITLNTSQPWDADTYIFYEEFSIYRINDVLRNALGDGVASDLTGINSVSLGAFFKFARRLHLFPELSREDTAIVLSTLRSLSNKVRLAEVAEALEAPPAARLDEDTDQLVQVAPDKNAVSGPLMDGYVRARLSELFEKKEGGVSRFTSLVVSRAEAILAEKLGEERARQAAETLGKLGQAIDAVAPAFLHVYAPFSLDDVVAAWAEELAEAVLRYEELSSRTGELAVKLGELGLPAEEIHETASRLVPGSLDAYLKTRLPSIVLGVGRRLGTAVDPGFPLQRLLTQPQAYEAASLLWEIGVVVPASMFDGEDPAAAIRSVAEKLGGEKPDDNLIAMSTAYSLYYALGIPVMRCFESNASATLIVSLAMTVDFSRLSRESWTIATGEGPTTIPSEAELVSTLFDRAIDNYLKTADRPSITDPHYYQGVLYIFSDKNLVEGAPGDEEIPSSILTELQNTLDKIHKNYAEAAAAFEAHFDALAKAERSRFFRERHLSRASRLLVQALQKINESTDAASQALYKATYYNPRYLEALTEASIKIYDTVKELLDNNKPDPEKGAQIIPVTTSAYNVVIQKDRELLNLITAAIHVKEVEEKKQEEKQEEVARTETREEAREIRES